MLKWILSVAILLTACSGSQEHFETESSATPIVTVDQLHDIASSGRSFYLLDVRSAREYEYDHLDFTDERIAFDSLDHYQDRLPADKETEIYCFCLTGRRSDVAGRVLLNMGYTKVYNVAGGLRAWEQAGYGGSMSSL